MNVIIRSSIISAGCLQALRIQSDSKLEEELAAKQQTRKQIEDCHDARALICDSNTSCNAKGDWNKILGAEECSSLVQDRLRDIISPISSRIIQMDQQAAINWLKKHGQKIRIFPNTPAEIGVESALRDPMLKLVTMQGRLDEFLQLYEDTMDSICSRIIEVDQQAAIDWVEKHGLKVRIYPNTPAEIGVESAIKDPMLKLVEVRGQFEEFLQLYRETAPIQVNDAIITTGEITTSDSEKIQILKFKSWKAGDRCEILRSDGSWSLAKVQEVNPDGSILVVFKEGQRWGRKTVSPCFLRPPQIEG